MDYPDVPIHITSSPTDWPTIYAAFAAAFFGAGAAFVLTIFMERVHERKNRLDSINSAVYGLLMSMTTLVNLKEQRLTKFSAEFDRISEIVGETNLSGTQQEILQGINRARIVIQSIAKQDRQLDGAFVPWQEIEFPMAPEPTDFRFTILSHPDLMRLVHVAKIEMSSISKSIIERNSYWRNNSDQALEELRSDNPGLKNLTFNFQMLSYRKILTEHVDVALVVSKTALTKLEDYRKTHLKRRPFYSRWLFSLLLGREVWTTYTLSQRLERAIPDEAGYKSILDVANLN